MRSFTWITLFFFDGSRPLFRWPNEGPVLDIGPACGLWPAQVSPLEVCKSLTRLTLLLQELPEGLSVMLNRSDSGREHLTLSSRNTVPVNRGKEFMRFDLFSVIGCSETFLWVAIQQEQDYLSRVMWHRMWDLQRPLLNVFE